jgi:D-galactonate transporter
MTDDASAVVRKATRRLLPLLFVCYVLAYLDRVNIGFAKLQMLTSLRMSDTAYGVGAGIFFIGYFLFEVPSNLLLHRLGARVWIARIMVTWGVLSALTMFVTSASQFYALRFVLGMAEAGFFPGIVYYLSQWFPASTRARIVALFMTGIAASGVIGGPLSGWILGAMQGVNGWAGWQWLFLLEGIPSVLMGIVVYMLLANDIQSATWLSETEKATLLRTRDAEHTVGAQHLSVGDTLRNARVLLLSLVYFAFIIGLYGISFWLPQLIRNMGVQQSWHVGLLSVIPYGVAVCAMILVGRNSDRLRERRWHIITCALLGAIGLAGAGGFSGQPVLGMASLTIGTAGVLSVLPLFWTLPTAFLHGASAAAGIAIINSIGNLAGFLSPYMVGAISDATGSPTLGLYAVAAFLVAGALLSLRVTGDTVSAVA